MEFCENCQNLSTSQIITDGDGKTKIKYTCRHCGNSKIRKDNSPIYVNNYNSDSYTQSFINAHIRHDNTLPRDQSIICPNDECSSHKKELNKVSYIRYNPEELKHIYFCHFCDEQWKT